MEDGVQMWQAVGLLMGLTLLCYGLATWQGLGQPWRVAFPSVIPPFVFQVLAYLDIGYLDPFFFIAVIASTVVCLITTLVVHAIYIFFKR